MKINQHHKKSDKKETNISGWLSRPLIKKKFRDKHKTLLFSDLHLLFTSGLDLNAIFDIIISQYNAGWEKQTLSQVKEMIISGSSLSMALLNKKLINEFEYNALLIGEESGRLEEILLDLKLYYEKKQKQIRMIKSALTYPIIVLITALLALGFMLNVIVPMFEQVFIRFQGELPALTRKIIDLSEKVKSNLPLIAIVLITLFLLIRFLLQKKVIKSYLQYFLIKLPYFGHLLTTIQSARFSHSMSLLTSARAPLISSMQMVTDMIGFYPLKNTLVKATDNIIQGQTLSESLKDSGFFDRKFISLIKAAEQVNKLDYAFSKLNDQYNQETEFKLQFLGSLIEPILIIFVGAIVAVILIAMYLPLFQIGTTIY